MALTPDQTRQIEQAASMLPRHCRQQFASAVKYRMARLDTPPTDRKVDQAIRFILSIPVVIKESINEPHRTRT
jgi:hypothetical protein